jgi:hypothetical protein
VAAVSGGSRRHVRRVIKAAGARLWLPTKYFADLDAIAQTFSTIKHWMGWRKKPSATSKVNSCNSSVSFEPWMCRLLQKMQNALS